MAEKTAVKTEYTLKQLQEMVKAKTNEQNTARLDINNKIQKSPELKKFVAELKDLDFKTTCLIDGMEISFNPIGAIDKSDTTIYKFRVKKGESGSYEYYRSMKSAAIDKNVYQDGKKKTALIEAGFIVEKHDADSDKWIKY